MTRKKLFTTSYHTGGTNSLVPVLEKMYEEKKVDIISLPHLVSIDTFIKKDLPYNTIADYKLNDVSIDSMKKILEYEKPDLLLTGTSFQNPIKNERVIIEHSMTLAARELGIPSVAVLDFWNNYKKRFDDLFTGESLKYMPDELAVMDQFAVEDMVKLGFSRDSLIVTGNPHFDTLKQKSMTNEEKEKVREDLGINFKTFGFYAGADGFKDDSEKFGFWDLDNLKIMSEKLEKINTNTNNEFGIVAKVHPRMPDADYDELRTIADDNASLILIEKQMKYDPQKLVLASDITFTPYSTLGAESVFMGKPVISLQPGLNTTDNIAVLTEQGYIPGAYTKLACENEIERGLLSNDYQNELVKKSSGFIPKEKGTDQLTQLIYNNLKV